MNPHYGWPGSSPVVTKICADCKAEFETRAPRNTTRCRECAAKRHQAQVTDKNRKLAEQRRVRRECNRAGGQR
jgi:DNA-directed RNA polymerase subunit RPC12/RpoP